MTTARFRCSVTLRPVAMRSAWEGWVVKMRTPTLVIDVATRQTKRDAEAVAKSLRWCVAVETPYVAKEAVTRIRERDDRCR